jgi:Holliday junction resolvase RusA-like endonuclease
VAELRDRGYSVDLAAGRAVNPAHRVSMPAVQHASPPACQPPGMPACEHAGPVACIEFTVPVPPRGWERNTPIGYGRSVKTSAESAYQRDIARFARQARAAAGGFSLIRGGVRLAVVAYITVPKSYARAKRADCLAGRVLPACKPDADNALKSVMDALTGVLWLDDKQCVAVSCIKVWAESGSLYVRVQAL